MKPITYKDNVSELVSISVKEAMQMLIDNDCKPVEVLDREGEPVTLLGVIADKDGKDGCPLVVLGRYIFSIYRRENYIIGYNGEKLPPLPEGYGLLPRGKAYHYGTPFSGLECRNGKWIGPALYLGGGGFPYSCPINSDKWRALFPPKTEYKPGDIVVVTKGDGDFYKIGDLARLIHLDHTGCWYADFTINKYFYKWGKWCIPQDSFSLQLEIGKWYECRDGSVVQVVEEFIKVRGYACNDGLRRLEDGKCQPASLSSRDAIRAIDPELSVSLSNLDHETANKVWKARS